MAKFGGISGEQLRQYIERVERLEQEKRDVADNIKDAYAEAKSNGFDTKVMRRLISLRKITQNERDEHDEVLDLYKAALGMLPLFEHAEAKDEDAAAKVVADYVADKAPPLADGFCAEKAEAEAAALLKKLMEEKRDDKASLLQIGKMSSGQIVSMDVEIGADHYKNAMSLVNTTGKCSTSFIQKELKIGFNRAARIIERLEKNFVISAADATGKRTVLHEDHNPETGELVSSEVANSHDAGGDVIGEAIDQGLCK